jgi:nucleotide-binding universal stress UspA family protein
MMPFRKVLVAVDPAGEDQAKIFDRALSLAAEQDSMLMILGCLKPSTAAELDDRVGTMDGLDSSSSLSARDRFQGTELDHSRAWLESLAHKARQQGREVEVAVEVGKAGPEICQAAARWGADVIVLGLTRRGKFADRLLGSVTHHVVHHAPCSVLMVHNGGTA